jgi:1-acyl-sn-glycerol-3-phosphate acyltransferase
LILPHVARFLLWLGGWTVVGDVPTVHKAVVIAAPHTSNWDGFWAIVFKVSLRIEIRWFVKDTMFWFPLGSVLRFFGGIPLNRSRARSAVSEAIAAFDEYETFYFGLAPEGTRSKTKGWKSGFYRIAEGANVPVVLAFLDYGAKRLGFGPTVTLTGERDADLEVLRSFYESIGGRWPDQTSPIELSR